MPLFYPVGPRHLWPTACKHIGMRRLRAKTQQKKSNEVHIASEPILAVNLQEAAVKPESIAAAVAEEPLPFVMGEMALWGVGMATLLIPVSLLGLVISPFIEAGNIFMPDRQSEAAA